MEKLYKASFIYNSFFTLDIFIYPKTSHTIFRKTCYKLYKNPWMLYFGLLLFILTEMILSRGKLYYSCYFIMYFSFISILCYFLATFNGIGNNWITMCNHADYTNLRWDKPRYEDHFWFNFEDLRKSYQYLPLISGKLELAIKERAVIAQKRLSITGHRTNKMLRKTVRESYNIFTLKTKLSYRDWTGIRWMHSGLTNELHPLTAYAAKNIFHKIFLIQRNWAQNYPIIQSIEKKQKPMLPHDITFYNNQENPPVNAPIVKVLEHNLLSAFETLKQRFNYTVHAYDPQINMHSKPQANPDVILDASNSTVKEKRILGLDQKSISKVPNDGSSYILSGIAIPEYYKTLDNLRLLLKNNVFNKENINKIVEINDAVQLLKDTADDLKAHQIAWASITHHFPSNYIPPMRFPENFCTDQLTPLFRQNLAAAERTMTHASDKLKQHGVGNTDVKKAKEVLVKEDLDIFEGSFIQTMMDTVEK